MSDGRSKNGGTRPGSGSKGYGKMKFLQDKVTEFSPLWWKEIGRMLKGKEWEEKKLAMQEFNKLQVKMIPTDIESGGQPLVIQFDPTFHVITQQAVEETEE